MKYISARVWLAWPGGTRYSSDIMRRLRVLLFLLLAIAVPVQGYAHFALFAVPCPMQSGPMQSDAMQDESMMSMADMADATMPDCCNDAETAEKTGQACKAGQLCHAGGQFFQVIPFGVLFQDAVPAVRFPHLADVIFSFDSSATWRPPAQF